MPRRRITARTEVVSRKWVLDVGVQPRLCSEVAATRGGTSTRPGGKGRREDDTGIIIIKKERRGKEVDLTGGSYTRSVARCQARWRLRRFWPMFPHAPSPTLSHRPPTHPTTPAPARSHWPDSALRRRPPRSPSLLKATSSFPSSAKRLRNTSRRKRVRHASPLHTPHHPPGSSRVLGLVRGEKARSTSVRERGLWGRPCCLGLEGL